MKVKNILMILGGTQYNVLNIFTKHLAQGFCEYGVDVGILDCRKNFIVGDDFYQRKYDLVVSMNGTWERSYTERFMRDQNTVNWAFLVDHPFCMHSRLLAANRRQIVSCVDRRHVEYVKKYYDEIPYVCFMPHGGDLAPSTKAFDDRKYDVSFFGTYEDPQNALAEVQNYAPAMQELLLCIIREMQENPRVCMEEAVEKEFQKAGLDVPKEEFRSAMTELRFIDRYVRYKKRHDVVDALLRHGIPVDVFGNGWEAFATDYRENLHIHGAVDYEACLVEMSESKIVLNTVPLFTDGSHERIFSIMGAKSVCFTDRSIYLEEIFQDEENLFFYSMDALEQLPEKVEAVLNGQYDVEKILEKSYSLVAEKHLWRNRAQEMLAYLENIF